MPKPRTGPKFQGLASALELRRHGARSSGRYRAPDLAGELLGCFAGENGEVLGFLAVLDFPKSLGSKAALEQLAYCGRPARHPLCKPPRINDPQLLMHQHDLQPLALPREPLTPLT